MFRSLSSPNPWDSPRLLEPTFEYHQLLSPLSRIGLPGASERRHSFDTSASFVAVEPDPAGGNGDNSSAGKPSLRLRLSQVEHPPPLEKCISNRSSSIPASSHQLTARTPRSVRLPELERESSNRRASVRRLPSYKAKYDRDMVLMLRDLYESLLRNGPVSEQRALLFTGNLAHSSLNENVHKALLSMVDDGTLSFRQLIDLMFPYANKRDIASMMALAYPPTPGMSSAKLSVTSKQLKELEQVFASFDTDKSGFISLDELREALRALNISTMESKEFMAGIDTDGDGLISMQEFVEWIRPLYFH